MNEPGLKKEDGLWLQSPQDEGVFNMSVNQLMLQNRKEWDSVKIKLLFPLNIANSILNVPLFNDVEEDKLIWYDDLNGNYSVRSAYNLLINPTVADARIDSGCWKWLWKAQAPPKTKHLIWRICKECLPTRHRLNERFVPCPLNCPICDNEIENDGHVIFDCVESRRAWQSAGLDFLLVQRTQNVTTAADRLREICKSTDMSTSGKVAMLSWVLWNNRNNWVWNQTKESGQQLGYKAIRLWNEWNEVQSISNGLRGQEQHRLQWQKPQQLWLKCNVDAGFHHESERTSVGWCVRDTMGRFILAGSSWMNGKCALMEGEALAVLEAMNEMHQRGYTNVMIETDSQIVA
jgi:hypothetical protein